MKEVHEVQDTNSGEVNEMVEETQQEQQEFSTEQRLAAEAKNYRLRAKKYKNQVEDLQAKISEFENAQKSAENKRLETDGNWKELYLNTKKEKEKLESLRRRDFEQFKFKNVENQFKSIAMSKGCVDPAALMQLIDMSEIELDSDLNADLTSMEAIVEREKSNKAYMFKTAAPEYKTGAPVTKKKNVETDITKMSKQEKLNYLKELRGDDSGFLF